MKMMTMVVTEVITNENTSKNSTRNEIVEMIGKDSNYDTINNNKIFREYFLLSSASPIYQNPLS